MNERYALIKDGVVDNVIMWDKDLYSWDPPPGYIDIATDNLDVMVGWKWTEAGGFVAPDPVPTPLPPISDRQFFQQASIAGFITKAEALAAVQTGAIPAALQAIVNSIPDEEQKFAATMILAGATTFERQHPFTIQIGYAMGLSDADVDNFFIAAGQL